MKIGFTPKITAVFAVLTLSFLSLSFADSTSTATYSSPRCNEFTFDATGSSDPDDENMSYLWEFGDGTTSNEAVVSHTYQKSGDYEVKLTVTDSSGLQCSKDVTSEKITANIPPVATFVSPDLICAGEDNVFDGTGSTNITKSRLNYSWDFGDGTTASDEKKVTKNYSKGGSYKVKLTVDDGSGAVCSSASTFKTVTVNEPPVADAGDPEILRCVSGDADMNVSLDASNSHDTNTQIACTERMLPTLNHNP
jgi:PKD repeat protein